MKKEYLTAADACAIADKSLDENERNLCKVLEEIKIVAELGRKQVLINIAWLDENTKLKLKKLGYKLGSVIQGWQKGDTVLGKKSRIDVPTKQWVIFDISKKE